MIVNEYKDLIMEPNKQPNNTSKKPPVKKLSNKQKERLWFFRWYGSELAKLTPAEKNNRYDRKRKNNF